MRGSTQLSACGGWVALMAETSALFPPVWQEMMPQVASAIATSARMMAAMTVN